MLSPILLYRNYILLLSLFLMVSEFLSAQKNYTSKDSIAFFARLSTIEELIGKRQFDAALTSNNQLLQLCEHNKFYRGQAWALIKTNDILIEKEVDSNSVTSVKKIIEIGEQLNDKLITGIGYLQTAQFKMYNNKPGEAEMNFDKALKLLPQNNEYTALAWNHRAVYAGLTSDVQKQTEYFLKALEIGEIIKDKSSIALVYSNLSLLYSNLNQQEKAIEAAKKAIALREQLNDYWGLTYSYCNLSQIYLKSNLAEAEKYADLCIIAAEKVNDDRRISHAIGTNRLVKNYQGSKELNLTTQLNSIAILEKQNKPSVTLARQYLGLGIAMSEGRLDSLTALNYLNKGTDMAIALDHKISVRDGYVNKTVFFKIRGDFYNAYENIKKFHLYKDSIINEKPILQKYKPNTKPKKKIMKLPG
jgi:two-component system, NarL family, sensor histidine kinase UhpB